MSGWLRFLFEPGQHADPGATAHDDAEVITLFENSEIDIVKKEGKGKFGITVKKEGYQQRKGDSSKGDTIHFAPTDVDLEDRLIVGLQSIENDEAVDLSTLASKEDLTKKLDPLHKWRIVVEKEGASADRDPPQLASALSAYHKNMELLARCLDKYDAKKITPSEALKECNDLLAGIRRSMMAVPEDHRPTFEHMVAERIEQYASDANDKQKAAQWAHCTAESRKALMTRYQTMKLTVTGGYQVSGAKGLGAPCNGKFFASKNLNGRVLYQNKHTGAIIYYDKSWKMQYNGDTSEFFYVPAQEEKRLPMKDVLLLQGHLDDQNGAVTVLDNSEPVDEFHEAWKPVREAPAMLTKHFQKKPDAHEEVDAQVFKIRDQVMGMRILKYVRSGEGPTNLAGMSEAQIFDELHRAAKDKSMGEPVVVFTRPFPAGIPPPPGKWLKYADNPDGRDFCTVAETSGVPQKEPENYGNWKGWEHELFQAMSCGVYEGCHNWYHNKQPGEEDFEHPGHRGGGHIDYHYDDGGGVAPPPPSSH